MPDHPTDAPRWQVNGERTLYDHHWVRLTQVDLEPPDGNRFWHHVVHLRPIAAAVVIDDHDRVLMHVRTDARHGARSARSLEQSNHS